MDRTWTGLGWQNSVAPCVAALLEEEDAVGAAEVESFDDQRGDTSGWQGHVTHVTCLQTHVTCLFTRVTGKSSYDLWLSTSFEDSNNYYWSSLLFCILNNRMTFVLSSESSFSHLVISRGLGLGGIGGTRCARIAGIVCQLHWRHSMRMLWQPWPLRTRAAVATRLSLKENGNSPNHLTVESCLPPSVADNWKWPWHLTTCSLSPRGEKGRGDLHQCWYSVETCSSASHYSLNVKKRKLTSATLQSTA